MQKMSGLDLSFAVSELAALQGKRIARIKRTESGIFLFKIGSEEMLFEQGVRLHLTRQVQKATESPDGFVGFLRKNFEGKTAAQIKQVPNERIVEIVAKSKEKLIFELFRKGNLLAVGEDGIIAACLEREETGGRKISRGEKYEYPKAGNYEIKKPEKIAFAAQENDKGEPVSFSCDAAKVGKAFATFSEMADYYYANQKEESGSERAAKEKMKKLEERLESQEAALARLEAERLEAKAAGDAVYANFEKVEKLASMVREMKKAGKSEEEISIELALHKAKISGSQLEIEA
jgi:predicted ribosome quality control (RQC) complex YloA/Tae2 family protein